MSLQDRLRELVEPIVAELGLDLFDLHYTGSTLHVLIDRRPVAVPSAGPSGRRSGETEPAPVDLGAITAVARAVSHALDEADLIPGRYTLEVSSPGLERPLRTAAHFARAVGEVVAVKMVPAFAGPRRVRGVLVGTGGDGDPWIEVDPQETPGPSGRGSGKAGPVRLDLASVDKARTVFEWGPETTKPVRAPGPARVTGKGHRGVPSAGGDDPVDGSAPTAGRDAKMTSDEKKVTAR
jgi:ribosome maturation factor RimP